jgi:adhesin/invasin
LPANGGASTISAQVIDISGNVLPGVAVSFSSDFGAVSPSTTPTNSSGLATATLTTVRTAKVTATAGIGTGGTGASGSTGTTGSAQSKDITVTVNVGPSISLGSITSPAIAGQPVSVTVTMAAPGTTQSPIRSAVLTWGDGGQTQLGSSSTVVSHIYFAPGTYTITATATDTNNDTGQAVASVSVLNRPIPSASITPDSSNPTVNTLMTYTISAAPPAGATNSFVQSVHVDFGDGNSTELGSQTGTALKAPHIYTAVGLYTDLCEAITQSLVARSLLKNCRS